MWGARLKCRARGEWGKPNADAVWDLLRFSENPPQMFFTPKFAALGFGRRAQRLGLQLRNLSVLSMPPGEVKTSAAEGQRSAVAPPLSITYFLTSGREKQLTEKLLTVVKGIEDERLTHPCNDALA